MSQWKIITTLKLTPIFKTVRKRISLDKIFFFSFSEVFFIHPKQHWPQKKKNVFNKQKCFFDWKKIAKQIFNMVAVKYYNFGFGDYETKKKNTNLII